MRQEHGHDEAALRCDVPGGTPNYYLIGELSPEADSITSLIRLLNPAEQKR